MWSCEVPVVAGDAVSDELLLQRRERVPLQHLQPVQQLWTHMLVIQQTRETALLLLLLLLRVQLQGLGNIHTHFGKCERVLVKGLASTTLWPPPGVRAQRSVT